MEEINQLVYKILKKLLEIKKSGSRSDVVIDINDIEDNMSEGQIGKYEVTKLENNKEIYKLSIYGTKSDSSFKISEIEKYDYITDNLSAFRRDELYSEELRNTLEDLDALLEQA